MKHNRSWIVAVLLLFMAVTTGLAQQGKGDVAKHEQKVRDMVAFLEYVLNTLGNSGTSARDKDVLITESYTKIFRDGKVQIEDDLDENRKVITNKDVQAYLKDVDFFFNDVKFEFIIDKIEGKVNANNKLFYKVSLKRNLRGTTVEGKTVNKTVPRYVEINYDAEDQDLKIVSIYTNQFNEKEALLNWWQALSYEWQSIFKKKLNIADDSVQLADLKNMTSIETLDVSRNAYIQNIEPLSLLVGLRELNLSNTSIADISPIRNLTELVALDLSHTKVEDITALKYSDQLARLNISHTAVQDLSALERMTKLESLEMQATPVTDFSPLSNLSALKQLDLQATTVAGLSPLQGLTELWEINVSKTPVTDLTPLAGLKKITVLNLDSTGVADINPLSAMENLGVLYMNYTQVPDLQPLQQLTHLERVYCDHTPITRAQADAFIASHPKVLVIFDSEDLRGWWSNLSDDWKKVFRQMAKTATEPSKEELAKVTNLDSVNFSANPFIRDVEPLRGLRKLKVIIANNTAVSDLSPLKDLREVRVLNVSNTQVSDLSAIQPFKKLRVLHADNTKVEAIALLADITSLSTLYVEGTAIQDTHVQEFLSKSPDCLVVYKTNALEQWWNALPDNWKEIFQTQVSIGTTSRREDLHRLIEREALHFSDVQVNDLLPLTVFVRLRELHLSGTAVSDLTPVGNMKTLQVLHATNSPIRVLEPLRQLTALEEVDVSNTPVEELEALSHLQNLKKVNCAGTQIKKLNALEKLDVLEYVDCSNTNIKKLDPISGRSVKTLKCYNTDVSNGQIKRFKKKNPECNVVYY